MSIDVLAGEREVVRVFALDLDPNGARAFATPPEGNGAAWPLHEALGAGSLDPEHVEVFPTADLQGVGLADYLAEGLGVDAAAVAPDRARLEAEDGHIVIVHSAAFGGAQQTLTPQPPLRLLGVYRQAQADPPRPAIPSRADAPPEITPTAPPPQPGPPSRGASLVVLIAILLAAVALLAAVFYFRSQPY